MSTLTDSLRALVKDARNLVSLVDTTVAQVCETVNDGLDELDKLLPEKTPRAAPTFTDLFEKFNDAFTDTSEQSEPAPQPPTYKATWHDGYDEGWRS